MTALPQHIVIAYLIADWKQMLVIDLGGALITTQGPSSGRTPVVSVVPLAIGGHSLNEFCMK